MDLSEDDRALINVLQLFPRISWHDAGTVLERHPTTLAAQWGRLRQAGLAWVTAHQLADPAWMSVSFIEIDCQLNRRAEVKAALCQLPEVLSVEESARNRDLFLTVLARNWTDLTRRILPLIAEIPGISKYQCSDCVAWHSGADSWNLGALDPRQLARLRAVAGRSGIPSADTAALPPSYSAIARELCRDGRATAAQIARATGLHPVTARRHLNQVLTSGTLTFRCDVAQTFSGYPVACQWFADVPPTERYRAAEVLRGFPGLRLCASTTGTSNFTFTMWMRSAAEVMDIETRFLTAVPGARIFESSLTVSFAKRLGWMIGPDSRASGAVVAPRDPGD